MANNARRKAPSTRGDITGRKIAEAQSKVEKEQATKASEMTMAANTKARAKSTEVLDLSGAKPTVVTDDSEPVVLDGSTQVDVTEDDAVVEAVVAKAAKQPAAAQVGGIETQVVEVGADTVKVIALFDVEQATVGYDTEYTLEQGRRYILPRTAANHFAERDLVSIIG